MAESYSASFARLRDGLARGDGHEQGARFCEHFDLEWQLERALEDKRPLEDLSALGLVKHDERQLPHRSTTRFRNGSRFRRLLASLMPTLNLDTAGPLLINRGFRESDVAALRSYLETHDLKAAASARTLPIAISFSKVVKKYDKIKRPVGKDLVFSYHLPARQSRRGSAARVVRRSHPGLDEQRVRVLHSYFAEMKGTGYWAPSDAEAGVAGLLALMRLPDFEQRATRRSEEESTP